MELHLKKALLLSFLSILALSFPCRATIWPAGGNLSAAASPPCDVSAAGCRIADLQPELEAIADRSMLGDSLDIGAALDPKIAGCGRNLPDKKYTPCTPEKGPTPRCDTYCRKTCSC